MKNFISKLLMGCFLASASTAFAMGDEYRLKLDGGLIVAMEERSFSADRHELRDCFQSYKTCLVDGVTAQGVIGSINTELTSVSAAVNGKRYVLDTSGMFNPMLSNKRLPEAVGGFCYDENNCGIRALLGDAGGTYVVEWIIRNQVVTRTVLASDDDLIELFRKNLRPTRYR